MNVAINPVIQLPYFTWGGYISLRGIGSVEPFFKVALLASIELNAAFFKQLDLREPRSADQPGRVAFGQIVAVRLFA